MKRLFLILLFVFLASPVSAGNVTIGGSGSATIGVGSALYPPLLKVAVISDTHYGAADILGQKRSKGVLWTADAITNMAAAAPELIGIMGDISGGTNSSDDITKMQAVFDAFTLAGADRFAIVGNHEFDYSTPAEILAGFDADLSANFSNGTGTFYGSFDVGGVHIILLDGMYDPDSPFAHKSVTLVYEEGKIPNGTAGSDDELAWLVSDLAANDLPALVFVHHGMATILPDDRPATAFIINRAAVRTVLEEGGNVVGVFSGHQHRGGTLLVNGIQYYQIDSMIDIDNRLSGDQGTYAEITVLANSVQVTIYEDDSVGGYTVVKKY